MFEMYDDDRDQQNLLVAVEPPRSDAYDADEGHPSDTENLSDYEYEDESKWPDYYDDEDEDYAPGDERQWKIPKYSIHGSSDCSCSYSGSTSSSSSSSDSNSEM